MQIHISHCLNRYQPSTRRPKRGLLIESVIVHTRKSSLFFQFFWPSMLTVVLVRLNRLNLARFMYSRFINKTRLKITELYSVKCCLTAYYSVVTDRIMKTTRIRHSQSILLLLHVWYTKYSKTHPFLFVWISSFSIF